MPSYKHAQLVKHIARLDILPDHASDYATWIKAGGHLRLLEDNANDDELIIYASGDYTFIHAVVVSEDRLSPLDQDDLLKWNGAPFSPCASYVWGGGSDDVRIERGTDDWDSKTLQDARPLVYRRSFEGIKGHDAASYEILEEYSHLSTIHWRPERHSYCRFDELGDWEHVVSVTSGESKGSVSLVSFQRDALEQYLAASHSILVRLFDFTLLRHSEFTRRPDGPEDVVRESADLFYRQKVDVGRAAYTRGVQVIRPSRPKSEIFSSIRDGWTEFRDRQHCEFIAHDWRNDRITNISADPSATTNYFTASTNSLPFETSPVFFRPEVLSKYKTDRDKYTINEEHRYIDCRAGWYLKTYDINEAGQVHTYICYLRSLPYQEQLYWKSFNEAPEADISERAMTNDFKGEWTDIIDPLQNIVAILRRWSESDLAWWRLREEGLLERTNTPRTDSQDEWAQAFSDLAHLVIEGFVITAIRTRLKDSGIEFEKDDKSLALLEKVLIGSQVLAGGSRLDALRTVQAIRSRSAAHSRGSRAAELERDALEKYGSYPAHFEGVCKDALQELDVIEKSFG